MNNNVIHYDLITDNLGNTLCIDNKIYYDVPGDYVKIIRNLEQQLKKQQEVTDRQKYLLKEQGTELKELYSEIDKLQKELSEENLQSSKYAIEIKQLQEQVEKQKEVIDKAIEYIKEKQKIQYKFALSHIECDDLLYILKEVSE